MILSSSGQLYISRVSAVNEWDVALNTRSYNWRALGKNVPNDILGFLLFVLESGYFFACDSTLLHVNFWNQNIIEHLFS